VGLIEAIRRIESCNPIPRVDGSPAPYSVSLGPGQSPALRSNHVYWNGTDHMQFFKNSAILTKWFSVTRLETRTKESNIYASIRTSNPNAK